MPLQTTEARATLRAVVAKLMKEARSTHNAGKEPVTHLCTANTPGRSWFPCNLFLTGPVLRINALRLPAKHLSNVGVAQSATCSCCTTVAHSHAPECACAVQVRPSLSQAR